MSVPGQQKTVRLDNLSVNGVGMARRKVAPYSKFVGPQLAEALACFEFYWEVMEWNPANR